MRKGFNMATFIDIEREISVTTQDLLQYDLLKRRKREVEKQYKKLGDKIKAAYEEGTWDPDAKVVFQIKETPMTDKVDLEQAIKIIYGPDALRAIQENPAFRVPQSSRREIIITDLR